MKSYFLDGLSNYAEARAALSERLPHWVEPWLLKDNLGDPIAFLTLEQAEDGQIAIQADLSGRHHDDAAAVIELLRYLRERVGGRVTDDDDNVL